MSNLILPSTNTGFAQVAKIKKYSYLVTGEDLLNYPIKKLPLLWEPLFIQEGVIAFTGASDVGKSSWLRQLAVAVALKETTFLGSPLNVRHGRVIYLATEDSVMTLKIGLQNSVEKKSIPADLKNLCYLVNPDNPIRAIEEQLKVADTDVVIVDSFGDVFTGNNLNDNTQVRKILKEYQKLAEKYNTLFIFLHHTGKRSELLAASKNNVLGSQGFEAKTRAVFELRKPDNSNKRVLHITKGNYISDAIKSKPLEFTFDDKQQFHFTGHLFKSATSQINTRVFDEEEKSKIIYEAKNLRIKKVSFDKILKELEVSGFKKIPSKGTLSSWLNESKNVQSV